MLILLITVSSAAVSLLIYLPLKDELEKSLIDNFSQLSLANYYSLQNSIHHRIERAESSSSRTMIRNAITMYNNGEMNIHELNLCTQTKYEE